MSNFDWTHFTTRIPVSATKEDLYAAWATRRGIEHWFLKYSAYARPDGQIRGDTEAVKPGDTYTWRWHGWPDDMEEHGIILDCNGEDFFKFSFGDAGICSVTIKKENGQQVVELIQSDIPSDDNGKHHWHLGCKTGWTFFQANLKSLLEGGLGLRNKDEALKNVVNA
jgi:hypothetical protein